MNFIKLSKINTKNIFKKVSKGILSIAFILIMVVWIFKTDVSTVHAYSEKDSNFTYKDLSLIITKSASSKTAGEVSISKYTNLKTNKKISIPSKIKYNGKDYFITEVGNRSFKGTKISAINLPDSIKKIDAYAFQDCKNLIDITIPKSTKSLGLLCFRGCVNLESVTITGDLKALPTSAFYGCKKLEKITMGKVSEIAAFAFYGCISLKNIDISNVKTIYNNAFENCSSLEEINLSSYNGSQLRRDLFKNCTSLKKIILSDKITTLEEYCFKDLKELKEINLDNVSNLGKGAFQNCASLEKVTLSEKCNTIGENCFYGCSNLKEINIKSVSNIQNGVFQNCISLEKIFTDGMLDWIGDNSFNSCKKLTEINLENIISIGENAFTGCENLSVILAKGTFADKYFAGEGIKLIYGNVPKLDTELISSYLETDNNLYLKITNNSSDIYNNINGTYILFDAVGDEVGGGSINIPNLILKPKDSYIIRLFNINSTNYDDFRLDLTCLITETVKEEDTSDYIRVSVSAEEGSAHLYSNGLTRYKVNVDSSSPKKIDNTIIQIIFYNGEKIVAFHELFLVDIYKGKIEREIHSPSTSMYTNYEINVRTYSNIMFY